MQKKILRRTFGLILNLVALSCAFWAKASVTVSVTIYGFDPDPAYIVAGDYVWWVGVDDTYWIYSSTGAWTPFQTDGGIVFPDTGTYPYYDDAGDQGTVVVSPNVPPSVTITNPLNNAVLTAPATFVFGADASDTDSDGLSEVDLYVGTNMVDFFLSSPFTTTVTNLAAGTYTLTAIAYDNAGASATNSITITVAPLRLTTPSVVASQFRFNATGLTIGKTNVLQFTTNMVASPSWTSIATNVASTNWMSFTNPVSAGRRFFRVLQSP